jgi:hypothetical protein
MGAVANKALAQCGLGFFVPIDICDGTVSSFDRMGRSVELPVTASFC